MIIMNNNYNYIYNSFFKGIFISAQFFYNGSILPVLLHSLVLC